MEFIDIDDFTWHDALIIEINIDREAIDSFVLKVLDMSNRLVKIIFKDLVTLKADLNFGVMGNEFIYSIKEIEKDSSLFKKDTEKQGHIKTPYSGYLLNTSKTNSEYRIYCSEVQIIAIAPESKL